jgi:hypothetical protein
MKSVPYCDDHGPDIAGFIWHDADDAPATPPGRMAVSTLKRVFAAALLQVKIS